jgi:DNA polymerase-1
MLPPPGDDNTLYLLDLSCWMYRFFATTGNRAAHNFLDFLGGVLRRQRPAYFAVCCDTPWPTFRHQLAPRREGTKEGYKAQRPPPDPARLEQIRWARELVEDVHGLAVYAHRGYEADDLIATLTAQAKADGMSVVILALDKDLMQLVDDDCVLWDGKDRVVGIPEVIEKFGVKPHQLRDYLAIVGDASDNVPGVRGAGPKAAVEILQDMQSLEYALKVAESAYQTPFFNKRPRYREMLRADPDAVRLSLKLVTLAPDVPLDYSREELRIAS